MSRATCDYCGEPVDTTEEGTYKLILGWVRNRSGGGGNAIELPSTPHAFMHPVCMRRKKDGIAPGQMDWTA